MPRCLNSRNVKFIWGGVFSLWQGSLPEETSSRTLPTYGSTTCTNSIYLHSFPFPSPALLLSFSPSLLLFLLFSFLNPGKSTRAIVLARWGGLGTHRYQVGFSGDVRPMNWDTLAYQPYFSQTAANVAYGFWSHDIEGPGNDPEMYVRWVQWAAFSGVLRSHDRGMSAGSCAGDEPGQGKRRGVSMV